MNQDEYNEAYNAGMRKEREIILLMLKALKELCLANGAVAGSMNMLTQDSIYKLIEKRGE